MVSNRGSALIETLVAAVILVSGVVAVASIFSVTTGVNLRNRQRTTATLLLYDKMEELRTTGSATGGSLDPLNPASGFMDYVRIDSGGAIVSAATDSGPAYLRLWQVQDTGNPEITIAVFAGIGATTSLELVRATGPR
jgi:type II secretory pathway pseudopilin PulG